MVHIRENLSDEVADLVSKRIYDGSLPAGSRINEVALSREIGVSRTPLREALQRLVSEEILDSIPRRGFFVRDLSVAEFTDIYAMRSILDPAALQLAGVPARGTLQQLRELNEQLKTADTAVEAIEIDNNWHLTLIGHCNNNTLKGLIRNFMRRTMRYELAYFADASSVHTAGGEHDQILNALDRGALPDAIDGLIRNLTTGAEPILNWLRNREAPHPSPQ
ncbi:MAG: GntR family transcriptional regulator [Rhodothermales bacterium]